VTRPKVMEYFKLMRGGGAPRSESVLNPRSGRQPRNLRRDLPVAVAAISSHL
jgi:hypothetical protein